MHKLQSMKRFNSLLLLFFAFILSTNALASTTPDPSKRMLNPTDSIEVKVSGSSKFLQHIVKPKQTLYSISAYYGLDVADLIYYNTFLKKGIEIDQVLKIPIGSRDIKWKKDAKWIKWRMIEVVYVVKPKDTVFRIAKTHFKMPVDAFRKINNMQHDTLEIGDKVVVGWIDIDGIPQKTGVRSWLPISLYSSYKTLKAKYITTSKKKSKKKIEQRGPAVWNKKQKGDNLYALHKTAPIGTILKVNNPMNNRTIYVKVIGRMQSAGYKFDTILVLSPAAAKALGGINKSFRVNITYYK